METTIHFSFQVSNDTVFHFKGILPTKFETPQLLWENIKYHCEDIESFELERLCFNVDYNGWSEKVTIEEIVNDPLEDEFNIVFE